MKLGHNDLKNAIRDAFRGSYADGVYHALMDLLGCQIIDVSVDGVMDPAICNPAAYGLARSASRFAYYYVVDREKFLSAVAEKHGREAVLAVLLELEP